LFSEQPSLARYPPYPLALPETSRIIFLGRQKSRGVYRLKAPVLSKIEESRLKPVKFVEKASEVKDIAT
jgi:hypothetical protein